MECASAIEAGIAAELVNYPWIAAAWLFGSLARGDAKPESDLDLAVLLDPGAPSNAEDELRDLAWRLERFSPAHRVDILVLGKQGPIIRHRILKEGKLVLDRDRERRVDFEGRTISEYLDWKPTHDIAMASVFRGLH